MAKIKEVELRVKVYAEVLDSADPDFVDRAIFRIESQIAESVEKAINSKAQIVNREGQQGWKLLGVNASIEL